MLRQPAYNRNRLNPLNDVVVKSDGSMWFSGPPYGILSDYEGAQSDSKIGSCHVDRLDPHSGEREIVADDFDKPDECNRLFITATTSVCATYLAQRRD